MSVINTNVKSLVAQNAMTVNGRDMSKTMEQLSTGKRINSAADDAAGLAISTKMTSQIRGLNQAVRNGNDGISLLQTAESATVEMTNMLQRMRELAVQAANDTNTSADREYLDLEYKQLMQEITRIGADTEFNGMNILNNTEVGNSATSGTGTAREVKMQVGANQNQTISINLKDFTFGTGTPAVEGQSTINLLADDLSTATSAKITITRGTVATDFNVTFAAGALSAIATDAQTTTLKGLFATAINNTVGFENVSVTSSGSTINVVDSKGGNVSAFTAAAAADLAVPASAISNPKTGAIAVGASGPTNTAAVFSGTSQINNTSIATITGANTAISQLDNAIKSVSQERATIGSVINRLTYATDNLMNVSTNAAASRSRILDTDYAQATTELARTQIIQQAATAMLAQANQQPSSVLSLLQ